MVATRNAMMHVLRYDIVQLAMTFNDTEFQALCFHTGDYNYMGKSVVLVNFDWPE